MAMVPTAERLIADGSTLSIFGVSLHLCSSAEEAACDMVEEAANIYQRESTLVKQTATANSGKRALEAEEEGRLNVHLLAFSDANATAAAGGAGARLTAGGRLSHMAGMAYPFLGFLRVRRAGDEAYLAQWNATLEAKAARAARFEAEHGAECFPDTESPEPASEAAPRGCTEGQLQRAFSEGQLQRAFMHLTGGGGMEGQLQRAFMHLLHGERTWVHLNGNGAKRDMGASRCNAACLSTTSASLRSASFVRVPAYRYTGQHLQNLLND